MVLLNLPFQSDRLESPSTSSSCGKSINIPAILCSKIPIVTKYLETKTLRFGGETNMPNSPIFPPSEIFPCMVIPAINDWLMQRQYACKVKLMRLLL